MNIDVIHLSFSRMNNKVTASVELGEVVDDGARISFRFTVDNFGREEVEVYASPRDGRRKGVFLLLSMGQVQEMSDIIDKAQTARDELRRNPQEHHPNSRPEEVVDAILISDPDAEAKVLYDSAKKCHASGNRTATVALLNEIIYRYPRSSYARKAKKSLGNNIERDG